MTQANIQSIIEKDIRKQLNPDKPLVIAIDGMAGSGKSTLAKGLANHFKGAIIHMDDFFLQDHQRTQDRLSEVGGNIDYERFEEQVIHSILNQKDIDYHAYNCQSKTMTLKTISHHQSLIIIEGAYALRPDFRKHYDLTYLLMIEANEQVKRLKKRNPDMIQSFMNQWIPMENTYIDHMDLIHQVDRVFYIE
jgi:uridine kinase